MNNEENNVEEVVENKPFSVIQYLEDNSKNLLYAGIALIVLAAGFWYYTAQYKPQKEAAANDELFRAQQMFQADSLDIALNGDDSEIMGLRDIAEEYGSTAAGEQAKLLAARALMQKGEYDEAIDFLKSSSFSDEIVAPLSICLRGDCHVELDNLEEAADLYMKAAKLRDNDFTAPYAYNKASLVYNALGDHASELEVLETINKDYKKTQFAADIEKRIAKAKAASK